MGIIASRAISLMEVLGIRETAGPRRENFTTMPRIPKYHIDHLVTLIQVEHHGSSWPKNIIMATVYNQQFQPGSCFFLSCCACKNPNKSRIWNDATNIAFSCCSQRTGFICFTVVMWFPLFSLGYEANLLLYNIAQHYTTTFSCDL